MPLREEGIRFHQHICAQCGWDKNLWDDNLETRCPECGCREVVDAVEYLPADHSAVGSGKSQRA